MECIVKAFGHKGRHVTLPNKYNIAEIVHVLSREEYFRLKTIEERLKVKNLEEFRDILKEELDSRTGEF
jgi:hypothetical protein